MRDSQRPPNLLKVRGQANGIYAAIRIRDVRDPHFQNGFTVLDPQPGRRVPRGHVAGPTASLPPVWDLAQWSSKCALAVTQSPAYLPEGAMRYGNEAKAILMAKPGSTAADLTLEVMGGAEYGARARKSGEPWVHLHPSCRFWPKG